MALNPPTQTEHYRIQRNWRGRWIARDKETLRALHNKEFASPEDAFRAAAQAEEDRRAGINP